MMRAFAKRPPGRWDQVLHRREALRVWEWRLRLLIAQPELGPGGCEYDASHMRLTSVRGAERPAPAPPHKARPPSMPLPHPPIRAGALGGHRPPVENATRSPTAATAAA